MVYRKFSPQLPIDLLDFEPSFVCPFISKFYFLHTFYIFKSFQHSTVNQTMVVDQITHHQLFAVVEEYVSMVFVNVTNDQAPKKWFTVNIVSVIISHANDIKGWCVVDRNMVDVLVEYASASKAGWAQTVRA